MGQVSEKKIGNKLIRVVQGDITVRVADAIVNAANTHLQHGGGVAGAIVRRGGRIIQDESNRIGYAPVGTSVITSAGSLKAKYVIHTVGPRMGEGNEDTKLKNAILSVLKLADSKGITSIAVPAVSAGIYGFPKDRCAEILVSVTANYLKANPQSELDIVEFCLFDEPTAELFRDQVLKIS